MTWVSATLGELASRAGGEIRTGPFGSQLHKSDYVDDPDATPVVMPRDVVDGRVDTSSIARIDDATRDRLSHHILRPGDIVLARRGDIGRRAWIGETEKGWLCGTGSMRVGITGSSELHPRFLYYYLGTQSAVAWLEGHAVGATMSNLSAGVVEQLPVNYPAFEDQSRIVRILDSMDALIENNRRRIEILEEMARLIYREWFVHFRFPGHDNVDLVDSELGSIPCRWHIGSLGSFVSYINRGVSPTYEDDAPSIVINQRCIRGGRLQLENARRHITKVPPEKLVRRGDVLVNSTGVGTLGRVAPVRSDLNDTTVDSHVTVIRPGDDIDKAFFAQLVMNLQQQFESMGVGSTGQIELSRQRVADVPVGMPPGELRHRFGELVQPMGDLAVTLESENQVLKAARDLLLPRLVSGELDVSELDLDLVLAG